MGTHPIFESDFDCLTERKNAMMNDTFERQLDKIMGESKNIILPPRVEQGNDQIHKHILTVLDKIEASTKENRKNMLNAEHENLALTEDFLNKSLLNWQSSTPTVSPVKVAQTKKLRKLSVATPTDNRNCNNHHSLPVENGQTNELEKLRMALKEEKSANSRMRLQLEKSHSRERQLRSQCEELLQTLDRYKSHRRKHSAKNLTEVSKAP